MLASNLTPSEIINILDEKRIHSPIIDRLCSIIEDILDEKITIIKEKSNEYKVKCPVCESTLKLGSDEDDKYFLKA